MAGATVSGGIFVANLWWYGFAVLRPAQILKSAGLYRGMEIGRPPRRTKAPGGGRHYSRRSSGPVFLDHRPEGYETVEAFDQLASVHDQLQEPFSGPVFEDVSKILVSLATPRSRILDCSCGGGT